MRSLKRKIFEIIKEESRSGHIADMDRMSAAIGITDLVEANYVEKEFVDWLYM